MALKKETIVELAKRAGVKTEDLEAAIKDEKEVDVALAQDVQVLTIKQLEDRDTNNKNEGITTGKEIGVKEVRKAAGLEDGIGKDPAKIAQAIVDKAVKDAKIAPSEKEKQLTEQITQLQNDKTTLETKLTESASKMSEAEQDRQLLSMFPKNRSNKLTDDEYLFLLKKNITIKKDEDGAVVVEKDGKILRDLATKNPIAVKDAVEGLFKERTWVEEENKGGGTGGRGGGSSKPIGSGGVTPGKYSEAKSKWEADNPGKNAQSSEFTEYVKTLAKENKDFEYDI